eukprot:s4670_g4.t1
MDGESTGIIPLSLQPKARTNRRTGILPQVVQQNRRTLETLYLEDLDAKTLLSCIAGCRKLHSLEVAKSSSAKVRPCADFPSGGLDLCMKVIVRCPKLWSLQLDTRAESNTVSWGMFMFFSLNLGVIYPNMIRKP